MSKEKTLQETTDAIWELDGVLEQWFQRFYPEVQEEVRNKLIVKIIHYILLHVHMVPKEKK